MATSEFYVVRRGSTSLSNKVILSGLSYEALGLLLTELSLRPGTPLGYRQMTGRGAGSHRVRKLHTELEDAGFRHRFLVRACDGSLRTITVVTDESMSSAEAWEEIVLPHGTYLIKIQTPDEPVLPKYQPPTVEGAGRQTCRSHRASAGDARSEQAQHKSESRHIKECEDVDIGQSPRSHRASITEARSAVARSAAARSTAARSVGAGRSPNTLRVKKSTPSPTPPEEVAVEADDVGIAGDAPAGAGDRVAVSSDVPAGASAAVQPAAPVAGDSVSRGVELAQSADVAERPCAPAPSAVMDGVGSNQAGDAAAKAAKTPQEARQSGEEADANHDHGLPVPEPENGSQGRNGSRCDVSGGLGDAQRATLLAAVPAEMLALTASQQRAIAKLVDERVAAGWSVGAIRQQLAARPLPPEVRSLFGLVKSRFANDVPVDDPPMMVPERPKAPPLLDAHGHALSHFEIDWGKVAIDHHRAQARGDAEAELDRRGFALAVGIEKYLLTSTY